ncbi:MAG: peptidoglycan recognition family protein [Phycisphaerales bacterium JB039]
MTVHHDGMSPFYGTGAADAADRLEAIRRSHVGRGWADIGYHFAIDPQGTVWEGRPLNLQGAHVKDNNEQNIGIVVLGNFQEQAPTPAAAAAVDRFVAQVMRVYRVPLRSVYTHQELGPTVCPGYHMQRHMELARSMRGALARA